jgi:lysozyme family protein
VAEIEPALARTLGHEGGLANDPADRGGLTYRGIARRFHPDWPGWPLVDQKLAAAGRVAADDVDLAPQVAEFYRERFWKPLRADEYPSQAVAEEVFDSAVNVGVKRASRWLQRALALLNDRGRLWPDLGVDGVIGRRTLDAMSACIASGREHALLAALNAQQGCHYLDLAEGDPTQERFLAGWLRRVV